MAKRYFNLYDTIHHPLNLWAAYKQAARGKRYRPAAARFEYNLEENLIVLEQELREETWRPGGYQSFYVQKPKKRLINAAPFRDRVVHHALMNVIEPLFERQFIFDSYANRKGKGTHSHVHLILFCGCLRTPRTSLKKNPVPFVLETIGTGQLFGNSPSKQDQCARRR